MNTAKSYDYYSDINDLLADIERADQLLQAAEERAREGGEMNFLTNMAVVQDRYNLKAELKAELAKVRRDLREWQLKVEAEDAAQEAALEAQERANPDLVPF